MSDNNQAFAAKADEFNSSADQPDQKEVARQKADELRTQLEQEYNQPQQPAQVTNGGNSTEPAQNQAN